MEEPTPLKPPQLEAEPETLGIAYDLSKLSHRTREMIIYELRISRGWQPSDKSGREYNKRIIDQLTHNPLAFFEKKLKDFQSALGYLKKQGDATPSELESSKKAIREYEEIVADLQRNVTPPPPEPALGSEGPFSAEQMRKMARDTEKIRELKEREETLSHAIEELRKQILALPDEE